jgi:hypothetical protein
VLSAFAIALKPRYVLVALPFFALLSPLTGLFDVAGAKLVFSDLLFVALAVQAPFVASRHWRSLRRRAAPLRALAIIYVASTLVGFLLGALVSLKPLLYGLQFLIVYLYTAAYARTRARWLLVVRCWLAAAVLGALVLLHAYAEGRNLDTLREPDLPALMPEDLFALFRATYYYSGFHYILGIGIVWLAVRLFFRAPWRERMTELVALGVLAAALVAMVNKTAIAAVAAAIVVTGFVLWHRFRAEMARSMVWIAAVAGIGAFAVGWQYVALLDDPQLGLIVERLFDPSSLLVRAEVYAQAVGIWASSPLQLLLGFGPDFLDNSGHPELATALKTSKETGHVEGTVDSAWLSYLIELGVPGLLVLAAASWHGVRGAVRRIGRAARFDAAAYAQATVLGGLVYLAIAMTTQMLGYTKTAWLPFQLLVIGMLQLDVAAHRPAARRAEV